MLALSIFPASRPASIVDADELNFCVRDGNRWTLIAINTNYVDGFCPSFICQSAPRSNSLEIIAPFVLFVNPSFPYRIKAQRSGFDLEATSHDTGGISRSRDMEHCIVREELVTRTGFEPMLKA